MSAVESWEGRVVTRLSTQRLAEIDQAIRFAFSLRSTEDLSDDRRRFTLSARYFVLAAGGLEAPRLLLASNRQLPAGIGNAHDLVGRFYMDHPKHYRGVLLPGPVMRQFHPFVRFATRPEPYFRISFSLSDEVQRSRLLPNHALYLAPVYRYQIRYPQERADALKDALRARSPRRVLSAGLALGASPQALWKVLQRCVYLDAKGRVSHYTLLMYFEQVPNPESRVYLAPELDALGMPKLVMDWRFAPLDYDSFPKILHGLTHALAEAGIGRLDFGPEPFPLDHTMDAAHHMGTTRMAATPAEGVVDRDCRVFGTDNLFIASSSVFPTGGSAVPPF
jgi:choline dehydrogenase-like flavoprotein